MSDLTCGFKSRHSHHIKKPSTGRFFNCKRSARSALMALRFCFAKNAHVRGSLHDYSVKSFSLNIDKTAELLFSGFCFYEIFSHSGSRMHGKVAAQGMTGKCVISIVQRMNILLNILICTLLLRCIMLIQCQSEIRSKPVRHKIP